MNATLRNSGELVELLNLLAGRTFVGAVDGGEFVELVFDDDDVGSNLITVFCAGPRAGQVALGFVSRELLDQGYVR